MYEIVVFKQLENLQQIHNKKKKKKKKKRRMNIGTVNLSSHHFTFTDIVFILLL
jgi:hypothetical protein